MGVSPSIRKRGISGPPQGSRPCALAVACAVMFASMAPPAELSPSMPFQNLHTGSVSCALASDELYGDESSFDSGTDRSGRSPTRAEKSGRVSAGAECLMGDGEANRSYVEFGLHGTFSILLRNGERAPLHRTLPLRS